MIKYRLALAAIAGLLATTSSAMDKQARGRLIEDLVRVESHGRSNLIGDGGKAYGCLQIHSEMVAEANRILGHVAYTHADMFDPAMAREVAEVVLAHYDSHIRRVSGHEATAKELAFIWNGGGSAWKRVNSPKNDTKQINLEKYWSKVSSR